MVSDVAELSAPEDWLEFDDFAPGIDTNRLPATGELAGSTMEIDLSNGRRAILEFVDTSHVRISEGGQTSEEWYEAVNVAPDMFFIDTTRAARPLVSETLIVNQATRRVLSVSCDLRPRGAFPGEPRVAQDWVPGVLAGGTPTGEVPHETRDLIGLRALYDYSPNHVYEHVYLSSTRYAWHNLVGAAFGHADVDMATTFRFSENQYVFGFREFIIPVASVFFLDFGAMRSTGKFFGEMHDGSSASSPAGAFIQKLSHSFYPNGLRPV